MESKKFITVKSVNPIREMCSSKTMKRSTNAVVLLVLLNVCSYDGNWMYVIIEPPNKYWKGGGM